MIKKTIIQTIPMTVYVAEDGHKFKTEKECEKYEKSALLRKEWGNKKVRMIGEEKIYNFYYIVSRDALISFIDYFSKKVVAWNLFSDQKTDKILSVLKDALKKRKPNPGLIIHSDKGSQMRSKLYRDFLTVHNLVFSYTELDHSCDQNAAQESFHASLKKEKLYQIKIYTYEDAYKAIYDYIEGFYNPIRIHSSIGYLSPNDFEKINS